MRDFVQQTLRRECLDFFILLDERSLGRLVREYIDYFNGARPHQGIDQQLPSAPEPSAGEEDIIAFPVLDDLHHGYRRAA